MPKKKLEEKPSKEPEIKCLVFKKGTIKTNKIGRNEKCKCGSGKKYKKCCGKFDDLQKAINGGEKFGK